MKNHVRVNVDEILADSSADCYRLDGFRILARIIARKHLNVMSRTQATGEIASNKDNMRRTDPGDEDNGN